MACYPCTHCNKCGMFSARAVMVCSKCGTHIPVGVSTCPECGCKKFKGVALAPAKPTPRTSAS